MNEDLSIQVFGVPDSQIPQQIASFTTIEDFIGCGLNLRVLKDKTEWYLGLLALGVETKFGEKTKDEFAKKIGISTSTLRVYRWVVNEYLKTNINFVPPERLSFGVLQSIAHLPEDQRQKFLEEAQDGDMSVERARVEVQKQQGKKIKPKFTVEYCMNCLKWHFTFADPQEWAPNCLDK